MTMKLALKLENHANILQINCKCKLVFRIFKSIVLTIRSGKGNSRTSRYLNYKTTININTIFYNYYLYE